MTRLGRDSWRVGRFADICMMDRRTIASSDGGDLPYLGLDLVERQSGEILGFSDEPPAGNSFQFGPQHVLYGKLRPYLNKVAVPDFSGKCSTELVPLLPRKGVDRDFLAYALRCQRVVCLVMEKNTGARMPRTDMKYLMSVPLSIPPLDEQRRIVDILKRADSIRRLRKQALETTRKLIPALFVDMFGDPASNPKGWEVVTLGRLISDGPQNGLYKHASAYGEGTPILRIDAFYDGVVTDIDSLRRLRLEAGEVARYQLKEYDIVINRVNSPEYLGKTAIVPELSEPTVFESNMMRFSVDASIVEPLFLIQYLQSGFIKEQILGKAKHAINQSSINQQDVKSFLVPLPPIALQRSFANRAADVISLVGQQGRHLAQAEALQQSLLAQFFS